MSALNPETVPLHGILKSKAERSMLSILMVLRSHFTHPEKCFGLQDCIPNPSLATDAAARHVQVEVLA